LAIGPIVEGAGPRKAINWKDAPLMGSSIAAAAAASKSSGSSSVTFLLLIVIVFVGFYFLMIRPQRRRQQQVQQQQRTVEPGARVRTTAGMYATVVDVDGDDVVLEVAPGVEVRYLRRAIMEVIVPAEEAPAEPEAYADDEPETDTDPGTSDAADHVGSAEEGLADSHDDLAKSKSDKDNVF
jgi:preprotein translocase subunit YajC